MEIRPQLESNEFDAFICYSRKNQAFARKLESALEAFRPPRELAVPQRELKIFRDEGDITGVEYYASVDQFIGRASKLIVICSPDARSSQYVSDEIRRFVDVRGKENIVPLLFEGIPNNEAQPDQADRMAFPEALTAVLPMPLATSYIGWGSSDRVDRGAFEASWYTLLANIYGVSREEIEQRERRRRRKRQLASFAIVGAIIAALATLTVVAWLQAREAERQRDEAVRQRNILHARQLAFQAKALLDTGIGDMQSRGVLLAVEAMRRYTSAEAAEALQFAIQRRRPLLWQVKTGGSGPGTFVAFSPDESEIVAVSEAGKPARVLDTITGTVVRTLDGEPSIVAWDPTGKLIAGATDDEVILWSAETGKVAGRIRHAGVRAIAFARQGDRIATSADGTSIDIWSLPDQRPFATLSRPIKAPYPLAASLAIHPDGNLLSATIDDGDPDNPEDFRVDIWSIDKRLRIKTLTFDGPADSQHFSADGSLLAVGVRGSVRLISVDTWDELTRFGQDEGRDMVSVNFDGSGEFVAAVGWDAPAQVWRVEDGTEVARLEHERGMRGSSRVTSVVLSPRGNYVATVGTELRMWLLKEPSHKGQAGRRAGSIPGLMKFGTFGIYTRPWPGDEGSTTAEDSSVILQWHDREATISDGKTHSLIATLASSTPIWQGFLSADGQLAALLTKGDARVFDVASGREIENLRQVGDIKWIALSGVTSIVAFGRAGGGLEIISSETGQRVAYLRREEDVNWARFSPQGKWLIISSDGTAFSALDAVTGRLVTQFYHDRPATTYLFTSGEKYLATVSDNDGTARIWDLETNRNLLRWHIKTNLQSVYIGFSADERVFEFVGVEYDDARTKLSALWQPQDLIKAACRTVNRELTPLEWRQYFGLSELHHEICAHAGERPES